MVAAERNRIEGTLPVHGDSAAAVEPTHSELVDEVDASNQTIGPVTPGMRTSPIVENLHAPDGDSAVSNRKRRKKVGRQMCNPKCQGRTTTAQV